MLSTWKVGVDKQRVYVVPDAELDASLNILIRPNAEWIGRSSPL